MDDGLGIYATEYIKQNFIIPQNLCVLDGGGLGFTLMTYFQDYDKVIIVSTTSVDGKSGSVFSFTKDEMMAQGSTRASANEVEAVMMLEICSILDEEMAEIDIVAMKPHDIIPVETNLTKPVKENFPLLIDKILLTLEKSGISLIKKDKSVSLQEILQDFSNPKQQIQMQRR
jgi:hydrogenase maturation protease